VGSIPAYPLDGPGTIDGGEELAPDVGDTRIGIVPASRRSYGTARVGYVSVPAPPIRAGGQDKERKNRQDGQVPAKRCFSKGKIIHIDHVFLFRIGDHRFRSAGAPTCFKEAAETVPE
jgi:hypothetical protein